MAARFLSRLLFSDDGGLPLTLEAILTYYSVVIDKTVIVPIGFKTDLASIPRVLWNVLPPLGRYDRAAVLHDWLYRTGQGLTRSQADSVFREAMGVDGVGGLVRFTLYLGVRAGGTGVWARYRHKDHAKG
jgi:hypothetical protein